MKKKIIASLTSQLAPYYHHTFLNIYENKEKKTNSVETFGSVVHMLFRKIEGKGGIFLSCNKLNNDLLLLLFMYLKKPTLKSFTHRRV